MPKAMGIALLACVLLLPSCSDNRLPTDLPLVVTETTQEATVQVSVDAEGAVFISRGGTTSRRAVSREEIAELRELMADADLDSLDGAFTREPQYIVLAGDVEIYLAADELPKRLVPILDWIKKHRR